MKLRWLRSAAYRQAFATRKLQGQRLASQRDQLSAEAVAGVLAALYALDEAMAEGHSGRIRIKAEELHFAAEKWLLPQPHRFMRGNVEVLFVALVIALGIRTFFVEPFKIPTGSMQPTLYGVNFLNLLNRPQVKVPTGWARFNDWCHGISYVEAVAKADGPVEKVDPVVHVLAFSLRQSFWIGGVEHRVWFPPDIGDLGLGITPLLARSGRLPPEVYHPGDEVLKVRLQTGDLLLADRLTYNFRTPARGEIVVFNTAGIDPAARWHFKIPKDEYFIKRLVGLPGDRVQIGNDRHLVINGQRLDAATPHFNRIYGFDPDHTPVGQAYWGHLNGDVAHGFHLPRSVAPLFPNAATVYTNGPQSLLFLGDNTVESLDSRSWGGCATSAVLGKCWLVFWPLSDRFGWGFE